MALSRLFTIIVRTRERERERESILVIVIENIENLEFDCCILITTNTHTHTHIHTILNSFMICNISEWQNIVVVIVVGIIIAITSFGFKVPIDRMCNKL